MSTTSVRITGNQLPAYIGGRPRKMINEALRPPVAVTSIRSISQDEGQTTLDNAA